MEHLTARKSRLNKILDPDSDSIKIEQGLGMTHRLSRAAVMDCLKFAFRPKKTSRTQCCWME